jgi:ATP-binding cassette, subfamily F, member 3
MSSRSIGVAELRAGAIVITLDGLAKGFAGEILFEDVSLFLGPGERVGFVGPNGAGKSTLMKLIAGIELPDRGTVTRQRGIAIGHLSQEVLPTPDATVLETVLRPSAEVAKLEAEIAKLPALLEAARDSAEQARLAARLAEVHARHHDLAGGQREARAHRVLAGLGFRPGDADRPLSSFSGGFVMRAELARLLVESTDVLLLDEPTNHLDLESVLWLQEFLAHASSALILISHDRAFLNGTVQGIVEIERRKATRYVGTFDDYVREKEERRAQLEAAARNQERRIRETERFIERFRAKASKATQAQSRMKALAREQRIVVERDDPKVRFRFPQPPRTSAQVLALRGVDKSYGSLEVYRGLDFELRRGDKTVLVGPNGAGKSTLLKMLAGVIAPDAGSVEVGLRVSLGYYAQHRQEMLDLDRTVLENARSAAREQSETFVRTLLGAFLFRGDDVEKPASVLSGGEKSRLALARVLLDPPSVLLMDEPTIHLDMASVDALIRALQAYEGALCFISHDVHFIRAIARSVVRVESGRLAAYPGDWDYYLWKRGQAATPASGSGTGTGTAAEAEPTSERSAQGRREERRRLAESRVDLAKRTRHLKREIEELERRIEELEREKAGLEADLADPVTYERGDYDFVTARIRHGEADRSLVAAYERWTELQGSLEAELERDPD